MSTARAALLLALITSGVARGDSRVTIEKATLPWSELERLLRKEGAAPPPRGAPRAFSVPSLEVNGEVAVEAAGGRAQLEIVVEVEVLADRWTVAPLLPASLSVAHASITAPDGRRGLLVRDAAGVSLAADGAGRYRVELEAEGTLERGHLTLAPNGLAGGRAHLVMRGVESITGRTSWRTHAAHDGTLVAEAALGPFGLDLTLGTAAPAGSGEAGTNIEDLEATTVLSLGGGGVTRLVFQAGADDSGVLDLALPGGARLWRVYVGGAALPASSVVRSDGIRLPLKKPSKIELAFTFTAPPLGIRGRYHLELPRLPVPVRGAHWDVWLPAGLQYAAPQAAMSPTACMTGSATPAFRPRTPITPVGICTGFERPVLEPGRAYVEGSYDQPL